jgi:hypothetical protein
VSDSQGLKDSEGRHRTAHSRKKPLRLIRVCLLSDKLYPLLN